MKRTHSTLLLRSMANSIQTSLQRQTVPLNLNNIPSLHQVKSSTHLKLADRQESTLQQQQKQNKIFILQKQITHLEKDIEASKDKIRSYTKQIDEYEQTTKNIETLQNQEKQQKEYTTNIRNRMAMLSEQISSTVFNNEAKVAEKEYYEELIQTYQKQYKQESQELMNILELETELQGYNRSKEDKERKIKERTEELQQWKVQTEYDLNQHKIKHNLKIARLQLLQFQDKCDSFCQEKQYRKIRELFCLFFKNYSKRNGIDSQQISQGFDLFICQYGLTEEFAQFIRERLVYCKDHCQDIQGYLDCLMKMENILKKDGNKNHQKNYQLLLQSVNCLLKQKSQVQEKIKEIEQMIKVGKKKMDDSFGHESIAVIQYLRDKHNKYDIKEIKDTLRQNKKEQEQRIAKVREALDRIRQIDSNLENNRDKIIKTKNEEEIVELSEQLFVEEQEERKLEERIQKLNEKKEYLESTINSGISKWRQRDQNKIKLKSLYQELSLIKKSPMQRKQSIKSVQNVRKTIQSQYPLAESRQSSKQSKNNSIISINQSKSILSLNNPFEKVMKKNTTNYEPILSDCQLILSKKLPSRQESKQLIPKTFSKGQISSELKDNRTFHERGLKTDRSKVKLQKNNKQNDLWQVRTKCQSQTHGKYSLSMKNSFNPTAQKGRIAQSQRASLSQMLVSKLRK